MPSLTDIANRFGTDKGSLVGDAHSYSCLYDALFAPLRCRPLQLLELGLHIGGPEIEGRGSVDRPVSGSPSLSTWLEYFDDPQVTGFDISDFSEFEEERFRFVRGDAGSVDDLRGLISETPRFDVIIDDASHASYHQQLALATLWPSLKPGGLYIIEDLHWVPDHIEAVLPTVARTRDLLRSVLDGGSLRSGIEEIDKGLVRVRSELATALVYDRAMLDALGSAYNQRHGLVADRRPFSARGLLRSLVGTGYRRYFLRRLASVFRQGEWVDWPTVKLAVIAKG
ncbi:MAG: hypothetical protein RIE08_07640 [Acidimicrobiales bacterium]